MRCPQCEDATDFHRRSPSVTINTGTDHVGGTGTETATTVTEIDGRLAECVGVDSLTSSAARAATGDFANPDGSVVVNEGSECRASASSGRVRLP